MIVICRPSSFRLCIVRWVNPNLSYLDKMAGVEKSKEFEIFADANGFANSLDKKGMNVSLEFII